MNKIRLDMLLVEKGFVDSRNKAQALIMSGNVLVNEKAETKPGTQIGVDSTVRIKEHIPYVSRGGLKLEAAINCFDINPEDAICADVGASTGGFTDVLLQHGATQVYTIDVGYGQLAWKLRQHERVTVMERVNARYLYSLPELIDLVVIDVSFISLDKILPTVIKWLNSPANIICLIKPQFEAGKKQVGKGGIIRDIAVHQEVLESVVANAEHLNLTLLGMIPSPITGAKGNCEFLVNFGWNVNLPSISAAETIEMCLKSVHLAGTNYG